MTTRRPLIAGNWKIHRGAAAGRELANAVANAASRAPHVDLVIAPPFTLLAQVASDLRGTRVEVAGQNVHQEKEGAFTGEISAPMLRAAGAQWVVVGHSERRQYFAESDEQVAQKAQAAIDAGLRPIICIGETLAEREANQTLAVVIRQLSAVIPCISRDPGQCAIAYEPVWAIGTGRVATPEQAQEVHAAIRAHLAQVSNALAEQTRVLYGGSVKPSNAEALLACSDIDGALVGGASLDAEGFLQIAAAAR